MIGWLVSYSTASTGRSSNCYVPNRKRNHLVSQQQLEEVKHLTIKCILLTKIYWLGKSRRYRTQAYKSSWQSDSFTHRQQQAINQHVEQEYGKYLHQVWGISVVSQTVPTLWARISTLQGKIPYILTVQSRGLHVPQGGASLCSPNLLNNFKGNVLKVRLRNCRC